MTNDDMQSSSIGRVSGGATVTRRDFLQKATKALIGGGVMIGALVVPREARALQCTKCDHASVSPHF
jgi:hypothetical protein